MDIYKILILIGGAFGILGACVAYLVTWNEVKKHDIRGKNAVAEGVKMSVFTFTFFILLSVVLAFVFTKIGL
jgi:hypothetical protein